MSKHDDWVDNDRDEIYGKGKDSKKKKKTFREHGHNRVRDFKREYSQQTDREDLNIGRWKDR
jgi:bisphosphoglycerate-dependent phosphoglycerate mutase